LSIGPQVTFTNSQYAMTYFGVDSIGAAAFANYQLTKRSALLGRRLQILTSRNGRVAEHSFRG
jgi:hypothetical protein